MPDYSDFKVVYHLCGGQAIPVFLNAIQFPEDTRHVLVATGEKEKMDGTFAQAENLKKCLSNRGIQAEVKILGESFIANDFRRIREAYKELLREEDPKHVCFDVTGGTKPMAFLALEIAQRMGIQAMYLDSNVRQCWWLPQEECMPAQRQKMMMDEFVKLVGLEGTNYPHKYLPSMEFLRYLLHSQQWLRRHIGQLEKKEKQSKLQDDDYRLFLASVREDARNDREAWDRYLEEVFFQELGTLEEQVKFLAASWFEYYTYLLLKEQADQKGWEIQLNVTADKDSRRDQEFDVIYTDGYSMLIVECKARPLKQDFVNKLEVLRSKYAGALGKAALVTYLPPKEAAKKEIFERLPENTPKISIFCGEEGLSQLASHMMDFMAGQVYE